MYIIAGTVRNWRAGLDSMLYNRGILIHQLINTGLNMCLLKL